MIKELIIQLKDDNNKRVFVFSCLSIIITLAFSLYNGIFGLFNKTIWHICISIYYVFLLCIKATLVIGDLLNKKYQKSNQKIIVNISYLILILITIAMIAPAILLIQDKRTYNWGLIPAITSATYTTYSITMSVINLNKAKRNDDMINKQMRLINLINSLMSVLILQNTLILANGTYTDEMKLLSTFTSGGILILIIILIVYNYVRSLKNNRQ